MKKRGAATLLAVLVLLVAACGGGGGSATPPPQPVAPETINIVGNLIVNGAGYVRGNLSDCAGAGPYADLIKDAPVTVSSGIGKPLAIGKITYSVGTNVYQNQLDECIFRYYVWTVPREEQYLITVGSQEPIATTFMDLYNSGGNLNYAAAPPAVTTTTTTTLSDAISPSG